MNPNGYISPSASNDCRAHYDCWLPAARLLSFTENDVPPNNIEQHVHTPWTCACDKTRCKRGLWAKRIMQRYCCRAPQGLSLCVRCNINKGLHSCGSEIGISGKRHRRETGFLALSYGGSVYLWIISIAPKAIFHKLQLSRDIYISYMTCLSAWLMAYLLNSWSRWVIKHGDTYLRLKFVAIY